jgi:hypothetical protein
MGEVALKHSAVVLPDTSGIEWVKAARHANFAPHIERYDLALALRVVRRMETSAVRARVFNEIKKKNAIFRLVDAAYSKAGPIQPLLLLAYMLKCALSVGPLATDDADTVSISQFDNEHHAIDRLADLVPGARLRRLTLKRGHLFGRGQVRATCAMLGSIARIWPFLSRLARSYSFMPAARIASALAFYMRFSQLFAAQPQVSAAIVASNYSPEALGMAAAAHRTGKKVIYINHVPVPANGALVPPVLADCAVFYGDAIRKLYESRSRCRAEVALIGQPWISRPMQWRQELTTVGIFLTSGTKTDAVSALVAAIRASHPSARILIRNHPVALLKSDFSDLVSQHENLEVTIGNPLDEEIATCDLIICGNSGVAANVLSGGRPVAYTNELDVSGFDYNGFVESGLVCHVAKWHDAIYSQMKGFYDRPEWRDVMQSYDAGYGADRAMLAAKASAMLIRHLGLSEPRPLWPVRADQRPANPQAA